MCGGTVGFPLSGNPQLFEHVAVAAADVYFRGGGSFEAGDEFARKAGYFLAPVG